MIVCVLLCYPVSIHMSQLPSTGRPISSLLLPHSPEGLSGYCFHRWCPDGRAGVLSGGRRGGKSLSGLYLRNRKL